MIHLHPTLLAGLLVALPTTTPLSSAAAESPSSEQALRRATAQLQRVWQQDPPTARRPFPAIRLVVTTSSSNCPSAAFPASGPLVLSCPGSGDILVRGDKLAALHGVFGEAAELFVVAYGLGQALIHATPYTAPNPSAPAATPGLPRRATAGQPRAGRGPGPAAGDGHDGARPLRRHRARPQPDP